MRRVLLLGGTTEASDLARALAETGEKAVFSYAGRTNAPVAQPLATRVGGFGGVAGLRAYLAAENISHVIDATHPFAAQISRNALAACAAEHIPMLTLQRPDWQAGAGDDWRAVSTVEQAVLALPDIPARVFLAIGKQNLHAFAAKPQHHYLLRLVDAPSDLPLPDTCVILARGPFEAAQDQALLQSHGIELIVAKNAGGRGARAKLDAARNLGLPVLMIERPNLPDRQIVGSVAEVLGWLDHSADLGV